MQTITIDVRVRYHECDPMNVAHHSVYPIWFEMARTELLRHVGLSYAEIERSGTFIVVTKLELSYKKPAMYDDLLQVTAMTRRTTAVRIEHEYEIHREGVLLCTGSTVLACLDRDGRPTAVPDILKLDK